jgi:hypothetical protein
MELRVCGGLHHAKRPCRSPWEEPDVTAGTKKVVSWLIIAFVAFYLIKQPQDAAGAVRGIGNFIGDGFQSLIQFFSSVFQ